jgi:pantoate--beta-alanine ligase
VVLKLLNIVMPDVAVFGAKDAQQARVIRRMVRDLDVPVEIDVQPTVREPDGLALSSRNRYLSPAERAAAPGIYAALQAVRERARSERDVPTLEAGLRADLLAIPGVRLDYADIVADADLQPLPSLDRPALAAVAVVLGSTRLIDNISLD